MTARSQVTRTQTPPPAPNARDAGAELFGDPVLGAGYDRIVSRVFKIDPFDDWAKVELALDPKGSEPAVLIDALDHAEQAARIAHRLLVNAQLAYEQAKLEVATSESALRAGAVRQLQEQRDPEPDFEEPAPEGGKKAAKVGPRKKTITNDDVTAEMHRLYPEDMAANATRLIKAKGTVEHLERCADLTKMRIRTLDTLVGAARR